MTHFGQLLGFLTFFFCNRRFYWLKRYLEHHPSLTFRSVLSGFKDSTEFHKYLSGEHKNIFLWKATFATAFRTLGLVEE